MKYHIVDYSCHGPGDCGAVDTIEEAEKIINKRISSGEKGGCRCSGSGWQILSCEEMFKRKYAREDAYPHIFRNHREMHEPGCRPYYPSSDVQLTHDDLWEMYE